MNIIIVGSGKVGYTLASQLVDEGHDITLIDRDADRMQNALQNLDIQGIVGNATSIRTQQEAAIQDADLFIAVTGSDEINLLSCLIAKKVSHCRTIARVRDPEYFAEREYLKQCMDLSLIINPEASAAKEISQLIAIPSAMEVDSFAKGRVDLLKVEIPKNSSLHNSKVSEVSQRYNRKILICVQERDRRVIIPDGNTILRSGDIIYIVLPQENVRPFCREIGLPMKPLKDVMLVGGSKISYYLAQRLAVAGISVKIVEKDRERCEFLSEVLPKTVIVNGDGTDHEMLLEEGLARMDAFVALTNMDEENVFLSLYANKICPTCKKITKNNRLSLNEIAEDLPVGSIVSPKALTAEYISQYVRSLSHTASSNVESVYQLVDNQVEALEFKVKEESSVTGTPLQQLKLKKGLLLCCIIRDGQIITPGGRDCVLVGDTVIVVTTIKRINDIRDLLQ